MEAADEEGDENGRIDFPEFLAVMSKVGVKRGPLALNVESPTRTNTQGSIYIILLDKIFSRRLSIHFILLHYNRSNNRFTFIAN